MIHILLIDDELEFSGYFQAVLEDVFGCQVTNVDNGHHALRIPSEQLSEFEVALIDMNIPNMNGFEVGLELKRLVPHLVTIMVTAYPSVATVIQALRDSQFDDYLLKDDLMDIHSSHQLNEILLKARGLANTRKALSDEYQLSNAFRNQTVENPRELIGTSPAFQELLQMVEKVAPTDSAILINGETGTGKELIARKIHQQSHRNHKPFIAINCNAIPSGLLESELFGHKKGAFTGAFGDRTGFFKLAEGGTLFLDEIGDMPVELQAKLLRVLQERQFFPVGSTKLSDAIHVDVRVISATHQNLKYMISSGRFRKDLFYRLNTVQLTVPPLCERIEDIEPLIHHFIATKSATNRIKGIRPDALAMLQQWTWEGNVRELEHVIERALLLTADEWLTCQDFPKEFRDFVGTSPSLRQQTGHAEENFLRGTSWLPSAPLETRLNETDDYERLWSVFQTNHCQLWKLEDEDQVNQELIHLLEGAQYLRKGHFGRIQVLRQAELRVPLHYLNVETFRWESITFIFTFQSEGMPSSSSNSESSVHPLESPEVPVIRQTVFQGLPDTYLFSRLYPPPPKNELIAVSQPQVIRAIILRYAQSYASGKSLKSIFGRVMPLLTKPRVSTQIEGLHKDGLEAMRAYLCGENQVFAGVARKLKSQPEWTAQEIQRVFPRYNL